MLNPMQYGQRTEPMTRKMLAISALLPLTLALAATNVARNAPSAEQFQPTDAQSASARLVYGLLSDSRYAYRPMELNDNLSADIFRRYLQSLDGQKLFFTQADINRFAPYRTSLDDAIK